MGNHSRRRVVRTSRVRISTQALPILLGLALATATATAAQAQTYTVIHNFSGAEGAYPDAGLTPDKAGNFYGTASGGGSAGAGTVFKLTHYGSKWTVLPLYSFSGGYDGESPLAPVTIGPDGTLYGTTIGGGYTGGSYCWDGGCGVVFNLKPGPRAPVSALAPWTQTVLHAFTGYPYDGDQPVYGPLIFDQQGNLYGTTQFGGNNGDDGITFKLTPYGNGWTENILYNFGLPTRGPLSGVVMDSAGNLYGTTADGGAVFELSPSGSGWVNTILHTFNCGNDGCLAYGGLVMDGAGNLYGATSDGGSGHGGVVYELSPYGSGWTYQILYSLFGAEGPYESLTLDAAGNLYGAAFGDGANEAGMIFKLAPSNGSWTFTDLHDFDFKAEYFPYGAVALDANGNLFGTASGGGAYGKGAIWEITP
jgi:uncharacterized repeat protein (TIGR03803 family)